jgi:hypothetical protein
MLYINYNLRKNYVLIIVVSITRYQMCKADDGVGFEEEYGLLGCAGSTITFYLIAIGSLP